MRRIPWQNAIVLTLFGAAVATACVVSSSDGTDDEDGGSGGFGNSSGKGGSAGKGGGDSKGGSGNTAGTTSDGGDTGTTGGAPASSGGAPGGIVATCDPVEGGGQGGGSMVVGQPYPDCDPVDSDDECQTCIQANCCEQSKNCNAFEPYNVCGYGGPTQYVGNGGEFLCWQECINEKVAIGGGGAGGGSSELPDTVDLDMSADCLADCATPADYADGCSGIAGDETNEITTCVFENCGDGVCFY